MAVARRILPTQREAYEHILDSLTERQAVVFNTIQANPRGVTMHDTAVALGVPLHTISGRFSELKAIGLIVPVGKQKMPWGRSAMVWMAAPKEEERDVPA